MSLGILIKAPEGLVLAAESRVTLTAQFQAANNAPLPPGQPQTLSVNFDNANKLLTFNEPYKHYGVVTYGAGAIGLRTAQSLIPEFETSLTGDENQHLTVLQFAHKLSDFFLNQWQVANLPVGVAGQDMIFNVAGFDDNEPYGKVYQFQIPNNPTPTERNGMINNQHQFGITFGGQVEIVSRLLMGYDANLFKLLIDAGVITQQQYTGQISPLLQHLRLQTPIQFMPLQDCVSLAVLLIKTTIEAQSLTVGLRGCGGAIDVAIITKNSELKFIKKKEIQAI